MFCSLGSHFNNTTVPLFVILSALIYFSLSTPALLSTSSSVVLLVHSDHKLQYQGKAQAFGLGVCGKLNLHCLFLLTIA